MAITTKIRKEQIVSLQIVDSDIANSAAISTTKLADGNNFLKRDGSVVMTGNLNLNANRITNIADPSSSQDAATKAYVDSVAQGLNAKDSVLVATTAAITLSGTQTIDGVATSVGDRVLVKNQSIQAENGVYDVSSGAWSRSTDSDEGTEMVNAFYFVESGNLNANSGFVQSTPAPITIGTTALEFSLFSRSADFGAGAGLTKTGNTFDVVSADATRILVNADDIDLAPSGVAPGVFTKATVDTYGRVTFGDNATTDDIAEGGNQYFTISRSLAAITGAASTVKSDNLTISRALISNTSGKIAVSSVTSAELGYLSGASSNIQNQLNTKQGLDATLTSIASLDPTSNQIIYFTGSNVAATTTLSTLGRTIIGRALVDDIQSDLNLEIGVDVQAFDADLSAIAALAGTSGLLRKTAANTYTLDTANYLTTNQVITLSGDATGSGSTNIAVELINIGTPGTYGNASQVPVITVDDKGRISNVQETSINIVSQFSDLSDTAFANLQVDQLVKYNGTQWVNFTPTYISGNQEISISGDASGSGSTTIQLELNTDTAINPGTYPKVTFNNKGLVTSGEDLNRDDLPALTLNLEDYIVNDPPNPTPNGTTTAFLTSFDVQDISKIMVFLNGVLMDEGTGNDYQVDGSTVPPTVNFTFPPLSSDKIRFTYFKVPN